MQRNNEKCAHCGQAFVRLAEEIPVVNRSDGKTFHLTLFSGPDGRNTAVKNYRRKQMNCGFVYAHDRTRPGNHFLVVVIDRSKHDSQGTLQQVEGIADRIADLLRVGKKLKAVYTYDEGELMPGFPK